MSVEEVCTDSGYETIPSSEKMESDNLSIKSNLLIDNMEENSKDLNKYQNTSTRKVSIGDLSTKMNNTVPNDFVIESKELPSDQSNPNTQDSNHIGDSFPTVELIGNATTCASQDTVNHDFDSATGPDTNDHNPCVPESPLPIELATDVVNSEVPSNGLILKSGLTKKFLKKKCKRIRQAMEEGDIEFLRSACVSPGGLVVDELRQKVWPKVAGVDVVEMSPRPTQKEVEEHPYYRQVVLDVNRSLQRFPPSIAETQRLLMLDQLVFLIMRILIRNPSFHYYQGYHDICVTFLLVLGEEVSFYALDALSKSHLSVFMEETMEPTIHHLEHMHTLLKQEHILLERFIVASEVGVAYCLSWLITWFGHVLPDYDDVVRLFDLFIVSHPWMPLYLTAVIVMHREEKILQQDCDMASVHSLLCRIPDDLPFEELITEACKLMGTCTPEELARARPYVSKDRRKRRWNVLRSTYRTIRSKGKHIAVPLVIAAAVLVTAVLYQAYNS